VEPARGTHPFPRRPFERCVQMYSGQIHTGSRNLSFQFSRRYERQHGGWCSDCRCQPGRRNTAVQRAQNCRTATCAHGENCFRKNSFVNGVIRRVTFPRAPVGKTKRQFARSTVALVQNGCNIDDVPGWPSVVYQGTIVYQGVAKRYPPVIRIQVTAHQ
jgi:hypothetical protein